MDLLTIILFSVGLAADCFAIAVGKGLAFPVPHHTCRDGIDYHLSSSPLSSYWRVVLMAVLFGVFQGGMPLIGYVAGALFDDFFRRFAPWVALVLLTAIGGKMIWESRKIPNAEVTTESETNNLSVSTLLLLAVATSIDALATGVLFVPYSSWLWCGVVIIAIGSFVLTLVGWLIGRYLGQRLKINAELTGGLILIAIGLKIWIEGLWF